MSFRSLLHIYWKINRILKNILLKIFIAVFLHSKKERFENLLSNKTIDYIVRILGIEIPLYTLNLFVCSYLYLLADNLSILSVLCHLKTCLDLWKLKICHQNLVTFWRPHLFMVYFTLQKQENFKDYCGYSLYCVAF